MVGEPAFKVPYDVVTEIKVHRHCVLKLYMTLKKGFSQNYLF